MPAQSDRPRPFVIQFRLNLHRLLPSAGPLTPDIAEQLTAATEREAAAAAAAAGCMNSCARQQICLQFIN